MASSPDSNEPLENDDTNNDNDTNIVTSNIVLQRQPSVLEEVNKSVWATFKNKPSNEDYHYAELEKSKYGGQELVTRSEILTWYLYDWANSPMFNILLALVVPLYLTALATEYGCTHEAPNGCDYNNEKIESDGDLVVYIGAWELVPASYTFTIISISGALQAFVYIGVGAIADYSYYKYYLFRICTLIASCMIIVFVFLGDPSTYLFAGWWIAFQLTFFGLALIFYNAYLPQMVEHHWQVRAALRQEQSEDEVVRVKQQLTDDMSQYGYALGYYGSLTMSIIALSVFAAMGDTQYEQFTGFGLTSNDDLDSYDEQWLKKVYQINMSFENGYLTQIQLFYDNIDVDGTLYGDTTTNGITTDSFIIPVDNDYITQIEYWYNSDDDTINSMRFTTQNGDISAIYGTDTISTDADDIMSGDDDNFIFAGYKVYVSEDGSIITGMDTIMLNEETGQFTSTLPSRIIILLVFLWWNGFQILSFKYFKRRDGPPLPNNSSPWTFSLKQFYVAMKQASLYPNMFRYLIAWFLFSDGLNTLATASILFATIEIGFSQTEAAVLLLETLLFGATGGILFLWIQKKIHWNAKKMLILHLSMFLFMTFYCIIGIIPGSPFGLVTKAEMFLFAVLYGLNFGSVQSYARSVFAYIVPVGKESQMFALYEITDKGSSWIGPLMIALIANAASIRWGLFYISCFFILSMPLLIWGVSLKQGMKQAGRWAQITSDDVNIAGVDEEEEEEEDDDDNNNTEMTKTQKTEEETENVNDANIKIKVTSADNDQVTTASKTTIKNDERTTLIDDEEENEDGKKKENENKINMKTEEMDVVDSVSYNEDNNDDDETTNDVNVNNDVSEV